MKKKGAVIQMFAQGEDLPLWSGTPQRAVIAQFAPQEAHHQPSLPGLALQMQSAARGSHRASRRNADHLWPLLEP